MSRNYGQRPNPYANRRPSVLALRAPEAATPHVIDNVMKSIAPDAGGLTHTLTQLRPHQQLVDHHRSVMVSSPPSSPITTTTTGTGRRPRQRRREPLAVVVNKKDTAARTPLSRWIFVYLPVALFAGLLLYALCEVIMKQLAWHSLQQQVMSLPETPVNLPPAPSCGSAPSQSHRPVTMTVMQAPVPVAAADPSELSFGLRSVVMRPTP